MPLLIDGYNLLHVTGLFGRAGSGLQGSREALLRFLASVVEPRERAETTIVFDAADAPSGLPRTVIHEAMTVCYASAYEDADAMLEELIDACRAPRSLLVVSSDHRVQRAARRRRAAFVDSDVWFADALKRRQRVRRPEQSKGAGRSDALLTPQEIDYWLAEFTERSARESAARSPHARKRSEQPAATDDLADPFPPGYGEDVAE